MNELPPCSPTEQAVTDFLSIFASSLTVLLSLAVIIAINSFKSYVHSKKNSEVEEKTEAVEEVKGC